MYVACKYVLSWNTFSEVPAAMSASCCRVKILESVFSAPSTDKCRAEELDLATSRTLKMRLRNLLKDNSRRVGTARGRMVIKRPGGWIKIKLVARGHGG